MNKEKSWQLRFYTIAGGQAVSAIGSSAVQFSLIWLLSIETSSPLMLAFAGLMAYLPQMLLGPFAGVWIDRLKRKNIVIASDMFIGAVSALFALYYIIGTPPAWSVCVILLLRSLGSVFHGPAMQAMIPQLVPQNQLVRANSISQMMTTGSFMLGPVIGAAMYAALPMWVILLTDTVGASVASLSVAITSIPDIERKNGKSPHIFREMKEGFLAIRTNRRIFSILIYVCVFQVFFMPLSSFYPLMSSSYFGVSAWHASIVEILFGVGMLACTMLLSAVGDIKHKFTVIHLGLLGVGISVLAAGFLPSTMWGFWIFAVLCATMGGSSVFFNIPAISYMQAVIAPEALGRVFSLMNSVFSFAMPVGLLISAPVAETFGISAWFLIAGVATILISIVSWVKIMQIKD